MTKEHENLKRLIENEREQLAFHLLKGKGYSEEEAKYYIEMTKWAQKWRTRNAFKFAVAGLKELANQFTKTGRVFNEICMAFITWEAGKQARR